MLSPQRRCLHCGALFTSPRASARFCSDRCRIGNHRKAPRPLSSVWLRRGAQALASELLSPLGVEVAVNRLDIHFSEYATKEDGREVGVIGGKAYYEGAVTLAISPDAVTVLGTLLHELVHIAYPGEGHGGRFADTALALGFLAPVHQYRPGAALADRLRGVAQKLGPMPLPFDPRRSSGATGKLRRSKDDPNAYVLDSTPNWVPSRKA